MRAWGRLLFIIVSAPVLAGAITAVPVAAAANDASAAPVPAPYIVAIDPGHGGVYNPNAPDMPFDPGAIGINGLLEKDATLAIALKLRDLLQQDDVKVLMTRTADVNRTVDEREATANNGHASLFVSIHLNSYTDSSAAGSLVLYPRDSDLPFAQTVSDALGRDLAAWHIGDDGVQLRDNWWTHAQMPTITVEGAYLSNPREAQLLSTNAFRAALAAAVRDGIEHYAPEIAQRKAAIEAWKRLHTPAPTPQVVSHHATVAPGKAASPLSPLLLLLVAAMVVGALRWPLRTWLLLNAAASLLLRGTISLIVHRRAGRRRRRAVLARSQQARRNRYVNAGDGEIVVRGRARNRLSRRR